MTKEEILKAQMDKAGISFKSSMQTYEKILEAMQEYAEEYHKDNSLDDPHYLTMKRSVVRWAIIENMITILAIVGLFYWTKSAWSFLLLLNINGIKSNFKRK